MRVSRAQVLIAHCWRRVSWGHQLMHGKHTRRVNIRSCIGLAIYCIICWPALGSSACKAAFWFSLRAHASAKSRKWTGPRCHACAHAHSASKKNDHHHPRQPDERAKLAARTRQSTPSSAGLSGAQCLIAAIATAWGILVQAADLVVGSMRSIPETPRNRSAALFKVRNLEMDESVVHLQLVSRDRIRCACFCRHRNKQSTELRACVLRAPLR